MIAIEHIQLAIPAGSKDQCRPFWRALGFTEIEKPSALRARGGAWFRSDGIELHLGVDPAFTPATKAHPGFAAQDLDKIVTALQALNAEIMWDESIPDRRRFFTADPVGNRLEFLQTP